MSSPEVKTLSQRIMHTAKCTECGQTATVPFKPTPDKPIYCRECFAKRAANPKSVSGRNDFDQKQAWARRRK